MTTATDARGYTATRTKLVNRLARVEGQVRGVARMVEEDRYCIDVLTQISAVQAALDKVALGVLADHAEHCIVHGHGGRTPEENSEELMAAVARLMRRG
jgi:CsoR family transcriptional regulator, copper-sensing transcriptional repressor